MRGFFCTFERALNKNLKSYEPVSSSKNQAETNLNRSPRSWRNRLYKRSMRTLLIVSEVLAKHEADQ